MIGAMRTSAAGFCVVFSPRPLSPAHLEMKEAWQIMRGCLEAAADTSIPAIRGTVDAQQLLVLKQPRAAARCRRRRRAQHQALLRPARSQAAAVCAGGWPRRRGRATGRAISTLLQERRGAAAGLGAWTARRAHAATARRDRTPCPPLVHGSPVRPGHEFSVN